MDSWANVVADAVKLVDFDFRLAGTAICLSVISAAGIVSIGLSRIASALERIAEKGGE